MISDTSSKLLLPLYHVLANRSLSVSVSSISVSQVGRACAAADTATTATPHQPGQLSARTKTPWLPREVVRREQGGSLVQPSFSFPGLPSCLPRAPVPHSALSGTGLQSMTHMPAPALSPFQPCFSSCHSPAPAGATFSYPPNP